MVEEEKRATISPCGRYRYDLRRKLDVFSGRAKGRTVVWLMLNPSTADAVKDDQTLRKVLGFSSRWNYEHVVVVNLFAYRATDPREMIEVAHAHKSRTGLIDPVGLDNDRHILAAAAEAELIVCGWGAHARRADPLRAGEVMSKLDRSKLRCLKLTAAGDPGHPLTLPYYLPLRSFP